MSLTRTEKANHVREHSRLPKVQQKRTVTSIKIIAKKFKGEVGMAVPKSTQARVVGIIT